MLTNLKPQKQFNFRSIKPSSDFDNIKMDTVPVYLYFDDFVETLNSSNEKISFFKFLCEASIENSNKWLRKFGVKKTGKQGTAESFLILNLSLVSELFLNLLNSMEGILKETKIKTKN